MPQLPCVHFRCQNVWKRLSMWFPFVRLIHFHGLVCLRCLSSQRLCQTPRFRLPAAWLLTQANRQRQLAGAVTRCDHYASACLRTDDLQSASYNRTNYFLYIIIDHGLCCLTSTSDASLCVSSLSRAVLSSVYLYASSVCLFMMMSMRMMMMQ
jgi:hypothetical protein